MVPSAEGAAAAGAASFFSSGFASSAFGGGDFADVRAPDPNPLALLPKLKPDDAPPPLEEDPKVNPPEASVGSRPRPEETLPKMLGVDPKPPKLLLDAGAGGDLSAPASVFLSSCFAAPPKIDLGGSFEALEDEFPNEKGREEIGASLVFDSPGLAKENDAGGVKSTGAAGLLEEPVERDDEAPKVNVDGWGGDDDVGFAVEGARPPKMELEVEVGGEVASVAGVEGFGNPPNPAKDVGGAGMPGSVVLGGAEASALLAAGVPNTEGAPPNPANEVGGAGMDSFEAAVSTGLDGGDLTSDRFVASYVLWISIRRFLYRSSKSVKSKKGSWFMYVLSAVDRDTLSPRIEV